MSSVWKKLYIKIYLICICPLKFKGMYYVFKLINKNIVEVGYILFVNLLGSGKTIF